jgi:hypothetical protein
MKVYKLKHIPTGLFYTPSRGSGNLSTKGKIYQNKPSLDWCQTIRIKRSYTHTSKLSKLVTEHFKLDGDGYIDRYFKTDIKDWEIIEL